MIVSFILMSLVKFPPATHGPLDEEDSPHLAREATLVDLVGEERGRKPVAKQPASSNAALAN